MESETRIQEERFREIFRKLHARHDACAADEWLGEPCRSGGEPADRPVVWSRRNGAWHRVDVVFVGAAPGNAGGKGSGTLGAHGTRIPFGGDVSGGNFDVFLSAMGLDRNRIFVAQALNQLPAAGGGEPSWAEMSAPAGDFPSSVHALRDTLLAAGPRLVVALGNVALRAAVAAARLEEELEPLPSLARLQKAGLERGVAAPWPDGFAPREPFTAAWRDAWGDAPLPRILWLTHPSAQNMSPYAGTETAFHARMRETLRALREVARDLLGSLPATARPTPPREGIYALPEWRERVGPRHAELDRLWREKGV